jgi:hypothetical protein
MDPSEASTYGSLDQLQVRSDTVRIPLSTTALADLADAAGSFFSVTAVVRDNAGLTQRLVSRRLRHCLVLTLAESAGLAAA